jgi:CheY-like chemotaxis protein/tRNA A-37 threonylcarbamoyl transferase component Bud32
MSVLIVEDDAQLAELVSIHLQAAGYDTVTCSTGEAALERLSREPYQLVLLDLVLPGLNGRQVLERIRAHAPRNTLPVIVVSGLDSSTTITSALRAGANDYVTKPLNIDLLLARCETVLAANAAPVTAVRRALTALRGTHTARFEPVGHCAECESALIRDDPSCPYCGAGRPDHGWPSIAQAEAKYLGRTIDDRYYAERLIARGGQGEVYRVVHRDLERVFAAKFVDIRRDRPERTAAVRERILGEIKALAQIQTPHAVRIHDVIQIDETIFALIMDYVNGRSVEQELNALRRLPIPDVVDIARQVAQGLVDAHQLGFVHRDIKPNNIMVEDLPGGGRFVRILDFGFVHLLSRQRDPGRFEGTVGYSAPEQLTAAPIDHRADIYALGITIYDMVTGGPPFSGKTEQIVEGHLKGAVPRLTDRVSPNPAVEDLDLVVQRMLQKRPADRYRDCYEVIRALDEVRADQDTRR